MPGEQHTDDGLCWVIKSHAPLNTYDGEKFKADKIIVIARNPIDVFPSFLSLLNFDSHSQTPLQPWNEQARLWDAHVKTFTTVMKNQHQVTVD